MTVVCAGAETNAVRMSLLPRFRVGFIGPSVVRSEFLESRFRA